MRRSDAAQQQESAGEFAAAPPGARSSAVLWTGRDDPPVRQFELADQPGLGTVASPARLDGDLLSERFLEVLPREFASPEKHRRRAFERPGLDLPLITRALIRLSHLITGAGWGLLFVWFAQLVFTRLEGKFAEKL